MIASYKDKNTENLATGIRVRKFEAIACTAQEKLAILGDAVSLNDLAVPPGNRLEALSGDRKGQHSVRINGRYRTCFRWKDRYAYKVEIVDYHW